MVVAGATTWAIAAAGTGHPRQRVPLVVDATVFSLTALTARRQVGHLAARTCVGRAGGG